MKIMGDQRSDDHDSGKEVRLLPFAEDGDALATALTKGEEFDAVLVEVEYLHNVTSQLLDCTGIKRCLKDGLLDAHSVVLHDLGNFCKPFGVSDVVGEQEVLGHEVVAGRWFVVLGLKFAMAGIRSWKTETPTTDYRLNNLEMAEVKTESLPKFGSASQATPTDFIDTDRVVGFLGALLEEGVHLTVFRLRDDHFKDRFLRVNAVIGEEAVDLLSVLVVRKIVGDNETVVHFISIAGADTDLDHLQGPPGSAEPEQPSLRRKKPALR